ncbi:MAG: FG-GAP repeat protein [Planctomycetes bacterium]|nr:FG-GAP repeat protein [Planctomycetota bacterium]
MRRHASLAFLFVSLAAPGFGQWTGQQEAQVVPSPNPLALGSEFGGRCALDGTTLVIGAEWFDPFGGATNHGGAWVFERQGTTWVEVASLSSSSYDPDDHFGAALALDGDRLVVGAKQEDGPSTLSSGAVYVFEKLGGAWIETARLVASDAASSETFGSAVALDGDRLVVGAEYESAQGATFRGAAYVFEWNGSAWLETTKLLAPGAAAFDYAGSTVALDDDRVIVGARGRDHGGVTNSGAAFVYEYDGVSWTHVATLAPNDAATNDEFGRAVALDGDTVLVGAPIKLSGGSKTGAAYVFRGGGATWAQEAKLVDLGSVYADQFGTALDLEGDRAVIGLPWSGAAGIATGGVQFFERIGSTWTGHVELVGSACDGGDYLGTSVALSGDLVAAGAPWGETAPSGLATGEAYVFRLVPPPLVLAYCTAKPNSQGCAPTMAWTGFPSASNPNPFELTCSQVLNYKWGLLFYGAAAAAIPFQGGTLCVAPPIERTNVQFSWGSPSGADCTGTYTYDMNARIQSGLDPNLVAGAAGFAQYWSRDPADPFTTSLSNAIEFHIDP